jgi:photosystem II stability/assembly factor-like uncharacterized protein
MATSELQPAAERRWAGVLVSSLLMMAYAAAPALSQTGWVGIDLSGFGFYVGDIVADPLRPNVAYAASGGVQRSTDWGLFWRPVGQGLPDGFPARLQVAPDGRLFALGLWTRPRGSYPFNQFFGLFESRDGAETWTAVKLPFPFDLECPGCAGMPQPNLAFAPDEPDTLYMAEQYGLFRTRDHGATWERLADSLEYYDALSVAVDPLSPHRLYAGLAGTHQGDGLFLSSNDGSAWGRASRGVPSSIVISPADPAVIWAPHVNDIVMSRDRGAHWSDVLFTGAEDQTAILIADAEDDLTAYVGVRQSRPEWRTVGLVKTADGGRHWSPLTQGLPRYLYVTGMAQDPADPNRLMVAGNTAIFTSRDRGASWSPGGFGLADVGVDALAGGPGGETFASANNILEIFDPATGAWTDLGGYPVLSPPERQGHALTIDPRNPKTVYAAVVGTCLPVLCPQLLKSTDGGVNWGTLSLTTNAMVADLVVDAHAPDSLYAAVPLSATGLGGIYKSTDGGSTWTTLAGIAGAAELALDPTTDPATLYAANGSLLASTDGGATWTQVRVAADGVDVEATTHVTLAGKTLYVLSEQGGGRVFRSLDRGATWQPFSGPLAVAAPPPAVSHHPMAVDPEDPATLYVGWVNGVWRSAGGPWQSLNDSLPPDPVLTLAISGRALLVGTLHAGALERSLDALPTTPSRAQP